MLAAANAGVCVGPQNKIGHPAYRHRGWIQLPVSTRRMLIGSKTRSSRMSQKYIGLKKVEDIVPLKDLAPVCIE